MGTELKIQGTTIYAGKVPGRTKPAFGIRDGNTVTVLGFFISEAECEVFEQWMHSFDGTMVFDLSKKADT